MIVVMPEDSSIERRILVKAFGAEVIITPKELSMSGAIDEARRIVDSDSEKYYMLQQFSNMNNVAVHRETTGPEIWEDTNGQVIFVSEI